MSGFADATTVKRVEDGRYEIDLDGDFGMAEAVNGGYLMAVLARAAVDTSPHEHAISTATMFQRTARPGRAEIRVDQRRAGRTTAAALVGLYQPDGGDERPVTEALITTATLGAGEPSFQGEPPTPELPPIEACVGFADDADRPTEGFASRVDMRFDPATMGWMSGNPSGRPELRAWFRLACGYEPDPIALALAVDALPPVALNAGARGWSPTVELTWQLRALPAQGWLRLHGWGRLVSDGWFDEEVEIWDSENRLVAQARQLARLGRGWKEGT